ncbi:hypothetical protein CPB84DRAFT_1761421 [Gymnopilus junonius]|uniref:Uncharacterized protein n=1 Tax=Gymnopilus junonius TaxID=109634 RepID=A0A9P5NZX5_GYMJU|nr:hypothetical protein CPB84DRAFT_1761421 [Gymnopilus junonius]
MSAVAVANMVPKVLPPPSPFGELLRRSHFASFDPEIRQAYTAPPSYIHRGNWGLKRPIANRHRNGHIVLRKFEEHAQYIEWDRADSQVKFIKRIEELNTAPRLVPNSPWFTGLGQTATSKDSGLDSDFCPGESSAFELSSDEAKTNADVPEVILATAERTSLEDEGEILLESTLTPPLEQTPTPTPIPTPSSARSRRPAIYVDDITELGNRGKGGYGAKAPHAKPLSQNTDETRVQPNIYSMTPGEFKKYLEKLRELRPEFRKYVREQLRLDRDNNRRVMGTAKLEELSDDELFYEMGLESKIKNLHMAFLGRYTEEHLYKPDSKVEGPTALANAPQPIRKQPHKFGGLVYAMPSELDSYYTAKPQPGFVLQDGMPTSASYRIVAGTEGALIASFAGIAAHLSRKDAGPGVTPLYEPFTEEGLVAKRVVDPTTDKVTFNTEQSERKMRVLSLHLEDTPRSVGATANNVPLASTRLRCRVVVDNDADQNLRENPYTPGSMEYIGVAGPSSKSSSPYRAPIRPSSYFKSNDLMHSQLPTKGKLPTAKAKSTHLNEKPEHSKVISALSFLLSKKKVENGPVLDGTTKKLEGDS